MKFIPHGFVLLIVLVFLQLFSLLGLYGLTTASITTRTNRHLWQRDRDLLVSKKLLHDIENQLSADSLTCVIQRLSRSVLARKPISWWQQNACSGNLIEMRYYYVMETLGNDPCGVLGKDDNNQAVIPKYYRITLYVLPDKMRRAKLILQSTMAKQSEERSICSGTPHQVELGRQMWRPI